MEQAKDVLELIFGDKLDDLKKDRSQVFALLKSENHNFRMGALWLLKKCHAVDTDILLPLCLTMSINDPNEEVRSASINMIGRLLASQFTESVSAFLAKIVFNDQESVRVKRSAYLALRSINSPAFVPTELSHEYQDRLAEIVSLARHPKLDQMQLDWARFFLTNEHPHDFNG